MPRPEKSFATPEVTLAARELGMAIKQARLARNRTRNDFAERARISAATLDRLEHGDVAVRMGAWFAALQAANLLQLLGKLSNPDADTLGRVERDKRRVSAMRKNAYPVKPKSTENDDYDF